MLTRTRPVVIYCTEGGKGSSFVTDSLLAMGHPASMLEGGLEAWIQRGLSDRQGTA